MQRHDTPDRHLARNHDETFKRRCHLHVCLILGTLSNGDSKKTKQYKKVKSLLNDPLRPKRSCLKACALAGADVRLVICTAENCARSLITGEFYSGNYVDHLLSERVRLVKKKGRGLHPLCTRHRDFKHI